jgi:hypothetical protein
MGVEIFFILVAGNMAEINQMGRLGMDDGMKILGRLVDLILMNGQVGI